MSESLRDQLLKAGLVGRQQVKEVEARKRKQTRQEHKGQGPAPDQRDQARLQVQRAQAEKAERDRRLNQDRQAAVERRARAAQARQIIEQHRVARRDGEVAYHFQDGARVKKIFVSPPLHQQLVAGALAIVRLDGRYELIPAEVVEKLRERDPACLVARAEPTPAAQDEGDYAEYQVPDDLMW